MTARKEKKQDAFLMKSLLLSFFFLAFMVFHGENVSKAAQ